MNPVENSYKFKNIQDVACSCTSKQRCKGQTKSDCLSSLVVSSLSEASPSQASESNIDSSLLTKVCLLKGLGFHQVRVEGAQELLFAKCFPDSLDSYWHDVCKYRLRLTVQLEVQGINYHLRPEERFFGKDFQVRLVQEVQNSVCYRVYEIRESLTGENWVHHHLACSWPDRGIPSGAVFKSLYQQYQDILRSIGRASSVIVHCRSGLGRTGTFIFARALLCNGNKEPNQVYLELHSQWPIHLSSIQYDFAIDAAKALRQKDQDSFLQIYSQPMEDPASASENLENQVNSSQYLRLWSLGSSCTIL